MYDTDIDGFWLFLIVILMIVLFSILFVAVVQEDNPNMAPRDSAIYQIEYVKGYKDGACDHENNYIKRELNDQSLSRPYIDGYEIGFSGQKINMKYFPKAATN